MSESSELRARCPGCGKSLRFPPDTKPGQHFKCPKCGERVGVPEKGQPKAEKDVFLPTCPACAEGTVKAEGDEDEEVYVCSHCKSQLSETMLGYLFVSIDAKYVPRPERFKTQVFTRSQLKALSEDAARTGKPSLGAPGMAAPAKPVEKKKPAPSPPKPKPASPDEPDKDRLLARELLDEANAANEPESEDELWWEVDEDALDSQDRGRAGKDKGDSDSLSVDDLLDEIR